MRLGTVVQTALAVGLVSIVGWEFVAASTAVTCRVRSTPRYTPRCEVIATCDDGQTRAGSLTRAGTWSRAWHGVCSEDQPLLFSPMYGGLRRADPLSGYRWSIVFAVVAVVLGSAANQLNPAERPMPAGPDG